MSKQNLIKYCCHCGAPTTLRIPAGDTFERHVCDTCDHIQYQNPKVVCGCIPAWGNRILLCRRAIEPRKGFWTLPAGFMENGETIQQGAARETIEEACAKITGQTLYRIYNLPKIDQVYIMFRGQLTEEDGFAAGTESLEVQLFETDEIPWDKIAFQVIQITLEDYLADQKSGQFPVLIKNIVSSYRC